MPSHCLSGSAGTKSVFAKGLVRSLSFAIFVDWISRTRQATFCRQDTRNQFGRRSMSAFPCKSQMTISCQNTGETRSIIESALLSYAACQLRCCYSVCCNGALATVSELVVPSNRVIEWRRYLNGACAHAMAIRSLAYDLCSSLEMGTRTPDTAVPLASRHHEIRKQSQILRKP